MVRKSELKRDKKESQLAFLVDFLRCGICTTALKKWHEDNNRSYSDFLKNGISVEFLEKIGNPHADRVAKYVKDKQG